MSQGKREPDAARGWAYVAGLLAEEEAERLEGLSDEARRDELRKAGVDPAHVPTVDALLAKAARRAKDTDRDRRRPASPAEGWAFVEGLTAEEEIARLEALSDDERQAELRKAGLDPAKVPTADALLAKAAQRARAREADPARGWMFVEKMLDADRPRSVPSAEDLLAKATARAKARATEKENERKKETTAHETPPAKTPAGGQVVHVSWWRRNLATVAVTVAAASGGVLYMASDRIVNMVGAGHAEELRTQAFAACKEKDWTTCERKLDEARAEDPAGENAQAVREARTEIAAGKQPPAPP